MNKGKSRKRSAQKRPIRRTKKSDPPILSPMQYADHVCRRDGVVLPEPYLPEMKAGAYEVKHKDQSGETLDVVTLRMALFADIPPKKIKISFDWSAMMLMEDGAMIRSTTPNEVFPLMYIVDHAHGDVLIGGLGIGLALHLLEGNTKITSVTCVESDLALIEMLSPYFPTVNFVHADIDDFLKDSANREEYDFVFLDGGGDSEGAFYSSVAPWRKGGKKILKPTSSTKDLVCWSEEVMRGQIIFSIVREINEGFDLQKLSADEIVRRRKYQRVDMDFFMRYGKLKPSPTTTALVRKFVNEWEYGASE